MITVVTIIFLLALIFFIVRGKLLPGTVLAVLPIIAALAIGTGFTETLTMAHEGMIDTATVVCVYIFAVTYFSIMSDAGLFDPIINLLVKSKRFGKTIFSVVFAAAVIAMLSHLDGSGVTTLMITVPPMLIVFDKLKIRRTTLGAIFVLVTGTMNLLPWGGPVTRAATVINMDLMELYWKVFPVQMIGLVISFIFLYIISKREEKEGIFEAGSVQISMEVPEAEQKLRRPKLFWFNLIWTILLLVTLFVGLPPHLAFLIGNAVALPVNYRELKEQTKLIKRHAGDAMNNVYTILCAGVMIGIMENTGMFTALANAIVSVIPASWSGFVPTVMGLFSVPLSFILNTDGIIFGIMPIAVNVAAQYGVSAAKVAAMFCVGRVMAGALCMTTASVYLGLGMMGIEWKDAFKKVAGWAALGGVIMVLAASVLVA